MTKTIKLTPNNRSDWTPPEGHKLVQVSRVLPIPQDFNERVQEDYFYPAFQLFKVCCGQDCSACVLEAPEDVDDN